LKGLGGKEKAGIDVVLLQAWILLQDLLYGRGVGKESQDILHCKSCAMDDGFAYHHFRINDYPFQQIFIIHEYAIGGSFDINLRTDKWSIVSSNPKCRSEEELSSGDYPNTRYIDHIRTVINI
jgi:hypothetical protein